MKRTLVSLIGLILCGVGVSMFLFSGMGVDPASVFELGIANVLHVSYGTSAAVINVVILVIVFLIDRSYINISSVLAIFGIGYTADFVKTILMIFMPNGAVLGVKIFLILIGLLILGIGIATYIRADLGVGAIDLVSEIISRKSKLPYQNVRIAGDIMFVIVGYLLGGTVGIGTLAAALLTGPVVQFVRPSVEKLVDSFIG